MGDARRGPLQGLRVVDASTGVAGPIAAMLLADLGADVVVVPPLTDVVRDDQHPGAAVWQRGKRVGALPEGRVDVVVSHGPLSGFDLPDSAVHLQVPALLPGVGWPADVESDALASSLLGVALRQHADGPGPVDSVIPVLPIVHGVWAAAATVAALVERQTSGRGQVVTVGGAHGAMVAFAAGLEIDTTAAPAARDGDGGGRVPFYRTYRCGDGEWLFLAALTPRFSELAFAALGVDDMYDDPRIAGRGRAGMLDADNIGWVTDRVAAAFASASRDEWLRRLHDAGCPAGPVLRRDDWLDHPQIAAIGMRVEVDDPVRGPVVMPGHPLVLHASPARVGGPAPAGDVVAQVSWSGPAWVLPSPDASGAAASGPLEGVKVLDLGAVIAGPYAGSLLAELGADVVKVEPPTGDSFRGPGFAAYNKGQRSLSIDLRHAEGRRALLALARDADVVIDNYRPGVLARLDLDRDALAEVNPTIVSLSTTGFGDGGPLGTEAGFDPVLQAMSGMMRAQGGDDRPVFFSVPVNDVTTAALAALGAATAVLHARRTGEGQKVTTSLAAVSAFVQSAEIVRFAGRPAPRVGGRDHRGVDALDRFYEASDGWIRLLAADVDPLDVELDEIGSPTVAALGAWALERTREQAVAALTSQGLRAVPVREPGELLHDPDALRHSIVRPDPRPGREGRWTGGCFAMFDRTPAPSTALAPSLGEHSSEVLAEAGLSEADIAGLVADGIVVQLQPRSG
jgi:crotonobetainyl-CoA:carnitine CoA-transferase CaiB-like acyl-CoA transferase